VQYKNILAMIFNEIKCHIKTFLGLVGGMHPLHPPSVRACCGLMACTGNSPVTVSSFEGF